MFGAPFSGGAPLSFVSPTREHASSDSSRLRTALPVSSLFAQPAFNVTNVDCSGEPDHHYDLEYDRAAEYCCGCLCHDAGLLFNVRFVAICRCCCALYHAVDFTDSDACDGRPECADFLDFSRDDSLL